VRILEAPLNIAAQPWNIAQGLRSLGHDVEVWQYGPNPFDYPCDRQIKFPPDRPSDLWAPIDEALERFDVFHFHFARTLVPRQIGPIPGMWDLPLYRAAGKPIFFTFHGSDVRLRSKHLDLNRWSYFRYADVPCDEDDILKRLAIVRTYANAHWICSPVNRPFVPDAGFHPRAILVEQWPFVDPVRRDRPRVVHIPSRRATKGTDFVLRGVVEAEEKGLRFDFKLIEGLPNAEVPRVMAEADILVDNLLLGDYEVTGLEAMSMGKTVIARIDPEVEREMGTVPVLNADPDDFVEVLRRAVEDFELRDRLAKEGRAFVEANHDATAVAARILPTFLQPPTTIELSFPDWAVLHDARRAERLEEQVVALRGALRTGGREVVISGSKRGVFTLLGSKIDGFLRRVRRSIRRRRAKPSR